MKKGKAATDASIEVKRLNAAIRAAVRGMKPPENLTVSEWADKHRVLSPESAAVKTRWRTSRTPYLKEIMDAFTDARVRHIVFVSASQVGKSECINNMIGYIIDQDPGSILFVQPTTIDAKDYSKLRIAPMIRDCPTLRRKVADPKSRDSANTITQKSYPGGILTMCGSQEAHALASKPIRYIFGDERDRWAVSAGKEGDPWKLAERRQTTFYNAKSVEVSTPTIKNASAIADAFAEGTMERYKTACPHCGEYNEINFNDIRFEKTESNVAGKKHFSVTSIYYICPSCGGVSGEREMKRQPCRWEADNPDAANRTRSFWLSAFVSPWTSWEYIVLEYLYALGDANKLQVVYNTLFGWLWENRGDLANEDDLLSRREDYPAELPNGVLCLTLGVDTQDDRMEYEVVGYGHFGENWGIKKGVIMGRPDADAVWQALDDVREAVYRFPNGKGLPISLTFVDEGGHFTMEVRKRCAERRYKMVFAVKGRGGSDIPYISPPRVQKIMAGDKHIGNCQVFEIGVDAGKSKIMHNLKVQTPGANYCHFPRRDDYESAYFNGLLSERYVYDPKKKHPWFWEKIEGHERNEPLDCRNYANAAFAALSPNLDAIERRLKGLDQPKPEPKKAAPKPERKQGSAYERAADAFDKKSGAFDKYYNDF